MGILIQRFVWYPLIAILLCGISLVMLTDDSEAEDGGPVQGMTSPLGWYVRDGDNVSYSDETILLNGDLIIEAGGTLNFENVELYSNARGDKNTTLRIEVREEGTLIVRDSLISSRYEIDEYKGNQPWRYKFQIYGLLNMTDTIVEYMWGDLEGIIIPDTGGSLHSTNTGGIEVFSDDVFIQRCTVTRGQTCGMNIWEGSPTILDTGFVENDMFGMSILDGECSAVIKNCSFSGNENRGVTIHANFLDFRDNEIHDNGGSGFFIINSQNVSFENLDISGNGRGLHVVFSDATFYNCSIVNNDVTMAVTNEGSVLLVNCDCDISGDDMDLHENCWAAVCVPIKVHVVEDGKGVEGAEVTVTGSDANYTWMHRAFSDSRGLARSITALMVRYRDYWYNLSTYTVQAIIGAKSVNKTMNITGPMSNTLELGNGDDQNPADDITDEDDDNDDLWEYIQPIIGVIVVLAVLIIIGARKMGERYTEDYYENDWDMEDEE